jgi:GNAT superfamily N-acetyltransferase
MTDYTIRSWQSQDKEALRALWQVAFGDDPSYIDSFFETFLTSENACVVAEVDGQVVSAMYIIPGYTLYPYRKNTLSGAYTYALATLPAYRGQGIGKAVYQAANQRALAQADVACVLPAEQSLYPFYEAAAGAAPLSYVKEARFTREELKGLPAGMAARIPALKYAGMREMLLGGMPHVTFPTELFELMEGSGADFFVLEGGIAATETTDGVCHVIELLDPNTDNMKSIASIAKWCAAQEYIVRTPVFFDGPGQRRPLMLAAMSSRPSYPMPNDLWWGFGLE